MVFNSVKPTAADLNDDPRVSMIAKRLSDVNSWTRSIKLILPWIVELRLFLPRGNTVKNTDFDQMTERGGYN